MYFLHIFIIKPGVLLGFCDQFKLRITSNFSLSLFLHVFRDAFLCVLAIGIFLCIDSHI